MNTPFIKAIRWILFIPLILGAMWIISFLFGFLMGELFSLRLSLFWLILFLFFLAGIVWTLFKLLASIITIGVVSVCPNRKIGGLIYSIITTASLMFMIYDTWAVQTVYSGNTIVFCSIITALIIGLWYNLVAVSIAT